ncbi:MAG TPA: SdrD B-like domain-containing protein [Longimicrobium sp.]
MRRFAPAALTALALAAACESPPPNLAVGGQGAVRGFVFLDRNGSGVVDAGDRALKGIVVSVTDASTGRVVTTATSDSAGLYTIHDVSVGRYRIVVDPQQLSDTLEVTAARDTTITVTVSDSLAPVVRTGLSYPRLSIAQARARAVGKPVLVAGRIVALLGDTAFLWDGSRAIRALHLSSTSSTPAADLLGDSVRIAGRMARSRGQPVLDSALVVPLTSLPLPAPVSLGTSAAATAAGGTDDAAAVQVRGATVMDTVTRGGDSFLRLNDGSGIVEMRIGRGVPFSLTPFTPGVVVNATGVLVPSPADSTQWIMVLRTAADLEATTAVSPFRPATPTGVTASATDSTVHLAWTDASSNETSFSVLRRGGGTPFFSEVARPPANATTLTDVAASNAAFGYRVAACNGVICSPYSDEAIVFTVPAPPTLPVATALAGGAIRVSWTDNSRVESEFRIERHGPGGSFTQVGTVAGDVVVFQDTGRTPGTTYTYRVRACNAAGCSPYSSETAATATP